VQERLIHEEIKRNESHSGTSVNNQALISHGEKDKMAGTSMRLCYYCQKPGHIKRNCFKFLKQTEAGRQTEKFADQKPVARHQAKSAEAGDEVECAFPASAFGIHRRTPDWIVDSGATNHMTGERSLYSEYTEFQAPEKVAIADGRQLNAVGKGRICLCNSGQKTEEFEFEEFCKQRGILHQTSVPYTPEQNGVAERMNRTLVESARSMIFQGSLDVQFWAEAVSTVAYLRNRCPTKVISNAPYLL
jgi:hypothetical protein